MIGIGFATPRGRDDDLLGGSRGLACRRQRARTRRAAMPTNKSRMLPRANPSPERSQASDRGRLVVAGEGQHAGGITSVMYRQPCTGSSPDASKANVREIAAGCVREGSRWCCCGRAESSRLFGSKASRGEGRIGPPPGTTEWHLTGEGYAIVAEQTLPQVQAAVERAQETSADTTATGAPAHGGVAPGSNEAISQVEEAPTTNSNPPARSSPLRFSGIATCSSRSFSRWVNSGGNSSR